MDLPGLIVGLLLIVSGLALCWVSWLGSQRRLPRNRVVGLRVPATRVSDEAWFAAHETAAGPLGVGGGIAATGGIGVVAIGLDVIGTGVVVVTAVATLVAVLVGAWVGVRAAREVSVE